MNTKTFTPHVQQVLVVGNATPICTQIDAYLTARRYIVTRADDGDCAMQLCMVEIYDCIVIDLAVIRHELISYIQRLRERTHSPIIALGARREIYTKIDVIRAGADDYIVKPCGMAEIEVCIFALLRRTALVQTMTRSERPIQLNPRNQCVLVNQRSIEMTPMEYAILSALMSAPGRVFSRVELSRIILDADTVPGRAIDVHISNIRTKIEPDIHNPRYVVTIYGRGYVFNDEVMP